MAYIQTGRRPQTYYGGGQPTVSYIEMPDPSSSATALMMAPPPYPLDHHVVMPQPQNYQPYRPTSAIEQHIVPAGLPPSQSFFAAGTMDVYPTTRPPPPAPVVRQPSWVEKFGLPISWMKYQVRSISVESLRDEKNRPVTRVFLRLAGSDGRPMALPSGLIPAISMKLEKVKDRNTKDGTVAYLTQLSKGTVHTSPESSLHRNTIFSLEFYRTDTSLPLETVLRDWDNKRMFDAKDHFSQQRLAIRVVRYCRAKGRYFHPRARALFQYQNADADTQDYALRSYKLV